MTDIITQLANQTIKTLRAELGDAWESAGSDVKEAAARCARIVAAAEARRLVGQDVDESQVKFALATLEQIQVGGTIALRDAFLSAAEKAISDGFKMVTDLLKGLAT